MRLVTDIPEFAPYEGTPAWNADDWTGYRFGRLEFLYRGKNSSRSRWVAACDCGNITLVVAKSARNGFTSSCGCLANELSSARFLKDETGNVYGRLTVLRRGPNNGDKTRWWCQCKCGNTTLVAAGDLRRADRRKIRSCGCLAIETATIHGYSGSKTYKSWEAVKYHSNGYVERWSKFENFLEDMGEKPDDKFLIRRNPLEPHGPDNSYWGDPYIRESNAGFMRGREKSMEMIARMEAELEQAEKERNEQFRKAGIELNVETI